MNQEATGTPVFDDASPKELLDLLFERFDLSEVTGKFRELLAEFARRQPLRTEGPSMIGWMVRELRMSEATDVDGEGAVDARNL